MKKILVKDILELIPEEVNVTIQFFAYGISCCTSEYSGSVCRELSENLKYDCLNAQVGMVTNTNNGLWITAEICK